ncbi:hypothetical protein B0H10DRAFT_2165071 [Mycena sp. CBHHK59/15]|nr:hypothetical protein B0H10DRAFT_2165071 [Mycena sp. CBHHK59/15]
MAEKFNFVAYDKELFWLQRRIFLEKADYRLRPKFQPGYVAAKPPSRHYLGDEHSARHPQKHIMDAERISDGKQVMLKWVSNKTHPYEVEIGKLFSSPSLAGNPRNHCIPILEVLQDPQDSDKQIIVMPRLIRFDEPIFDTVGEVVDCFRQIFEGIQFMHQNFVAHRDCGLLNIMQDPARLYPAGFHPVNYCMNPNNDGLAHSITRTACWPRYYIIDFGLSRRYNPSKGPPLETIILSGDTSPPESAEVECNPFPTDIYYLGNLLKRYFIRGPSSVRGGGNHAPLRFLKPLADDMTHRDPTMRPTIGEVIQRFDQECAQLSEWQLRRPGQALEWHAWIDHVFRQLRNTIKRVPPLPPKRSASAVPVLSNRMRTFFTKTPGRKEKPGVKC